nr:DNA cytosine methyltransferase [Paenibacillus roseus]
MRNYRHYGSPHEGFNVIIRFLLREIKLNYGKVVIYTKNYDATPQREINGFTIAEVFAGGGLMAVGLKAAGYSLVWANDFDKRACQAYAVNIGEHIIHGDITQIDPDNIPDTDIIAGGPPCQDYSVAGTGDGEEGERGRLVWTYLNVIERKKPKAFIFENVKGIVSKRHRQTFDALIERFESLGYTVSWQVVNAWDYGVAQKRERVFIVGIRKDIGITFEFPEPDAEGYRTQTLRDAIGDLPEPHGIELSERAHAYLERDPRRLQKHRPPTYNEAVPTYNEAVPTYNEAVPTLPAVLHKGVPYGLFYPPNHKEYHITEAQFSHAKKHLLGYNPSLDTPARVIRAKAENFADFPNTRPRRFTVRECLRIQSVPDSYVFPDSISLSAQYRIVGNGVASRVAYLLGISLAQQLRKALENKSEKEAVLVG